MLHASDPVTFTDDVTMNVISVLLQLDASSTETPPSRSQKIAQAKWEFLFGQTEVSGCRKGQFICVGPGGSQRRSARRPLRALTSSFGSFI